MCERPFEGGRRHLLPVIVSEPPLDVDPHHVVMAIEDHLKEFSILERSANQLSVCGGFHFGEAMPEVKASI